MIQIPAGDFAAYIFDCDGTLADTMPCHYKAWTTVFAESGCEFPEALFYELGGVTTRRVVEILNERHGYHLPPEETARRKEELYLQLASDIAPIEPVVAIVNQIHGRLPIAVASGGHRHIVHATLRGLGLLEKFDAIICSEDYTNGKPSPEPFLTAAARLRVEPAKCLVFEDTKTGTDAAEAAGMRWVLVPPPVRKGV